VSQAALVAEDTTWQRVEGVLFVTRCGAKSVSATSQFPIEPLLALLPSVPLHAEVLRTAMLVLLDLSEFLQSHPGLLGGVVPLLLSGLQVPVVRVVAAAAAALAQLCDDCTDHLAPWADAILLHLQPLLAMDDGEAAVELKTKAVKSFSKVSFSFFSVVFAIC
jgi:transportin-3